MEVIVLGWVGRAGSVPVKNVLVSEGPKYRSSHLWAAAKVGSELLYRNPASTERILCSSKFVFIERPIDSFAQGMNRVGLSEKSRTPALVR